MQPEAEQLNVEYFFRKLYELFYGTERVLDFSAFSSFVAHLWIWIIWFGYLFSVLALVMIVYTLMRLFELRKREEEHFHTLIEPKKQGSANARWEHIESLMKTTDVSKWKEAIIEADIMLDDVLLRRGYQGEGVSEKLKSADPAHFRTLQDAWDAHKVRNQIAHQGSTFELSESLAHRTIAHYENVFREFDAL